MNPTHFKYETTLNFTFLLFLVKAITANLKVESRLVVVTYTSIEALL